MNHIRKRLLSLVLAISIVGSFLINTTTFASATDAVLGVDVATLEFLKEVYDIKDSISQKIADAVDFRFTWADDVTDHPERLLKGLTEYSSGGWFGSALAQYPDVVETYQALKHFLTNDAQVPSQMKIDVKEDHAAGNVYRPYYVSTGEWFVDVDGRYPYCSKEAWEAFNGTGGNTAAQWSSKSGHFVDTTNIDTSNIVVVSKEVLDALHKELVENGETCSLVKSNFNGVVYWTILKSSGTRGAMFCNKSNRPIVASYEPAMADQEINYNTQITVDQTDNSTTENTIDLSKVWDMTNGQFYFLNENGDKITQNIDSISFNTDNSTYTVNTYDYTYNTTNNYYEFNYYTYNIQYTYNNTYVTYIGSTAEYQPTEYRLYYELPDGRSSADLTEADIAGLSFQFCDVLNYKRSATDVSLRALYHFDGDTEDSSYFSTEDSFTWNAGASITYMESNAFNGALYLDEKDHKFTLTLPSSIGTKDFTIQWRYYQNNATTVSEEHNDNFVCFSDKALLSWSQNYFFPLVDPICPLSVGTWQEVALIRNNGILYYYHNGVCYCSAPLTDVFNNQIWFYFGSASRAYSMIDELRVTNFAVAEGGTSYTPTVVPYDTNSVLVLPDSADPVADEYYQWDTSIKPVFTLNCENTLNFVQPSRTDSASQFIWYKDQLTVGDMIISSDPNIFSDGSLLSFTAGTSTWSTDYGDYVEQIRLTGSSPSAAVVLGLKLGRGSKLPFDGTYTLTVVGEDLTRYSVPLNLSGTGNFEYKNVSVPFPFGTLNFTEFLMIDDENNDPYGSVALLSFGLAPNSTLSFRYIELVPGSTPNTGHELVTAIYDKTELKPNTAAIQSDIPVNEYTVGGVRPTFPARGDVWFPVEDHRISGVYIYNGRAWEETNARWWTGSRWIPIYAFDIVTLQDMWDVVGDDGQPIQSTITSEYSFWNWWQKEWTDFRKWLTSVWGSGGAGSSGDGSDSSSGSLWSNIKDTLSNSLLLLVETLFQLIATVLEKLLTLVSDFLSFIFGFLTETVLGGITSFFSAFTDGTLFDIFKQEGANGEISTALPEGIPAVFAFFAGVMMALPTELRGLLIFGVAALVLLSVLKFLKS